MFHFRHAVRMAFWFAAFSIAGDAVAQVPARIDDASCRRFAQAFYDWYAPITQKKLNVPASDVALREKADAFTAELLRALKLDSEAQARTKDDIVGLDFDPFVGGQDPASRYEVRRATVLDGRCSVEVAATKSKDSPVVAELVSDKGRWRFANFRYPDLKTDLAAVLTQLAEERRKH